MTTEPPPLDGELLPARRSVALKRHNLATLNGVRREMVSVYRASRSGSVAMSDGSRLIFMLGQIGRILELTEIEKRLDRLEGAQHENL